MYAFDFTETGHCIGEEMRRREVHLVKLTNNDERGSMQRQVKELIMNMTKFNPEERLKIAEVCSKLKSKLYLLSISRFISIFYLFHDNFHSDKYEKVILFFFLFFSFDDCRCIG